jgi:predicted ribosomally synthesized peptide with SipW-like signal peptide
MTGSRPQTSPRASIRVRAALAGGLVFGLGAGLTVASWTDAEFTRSTFTASAFGVQTSLNGAAFTTSSTISASASGLYPSATLTSGRQYVSLRVQTTAASVAGTVRLSATAATGALAPVLQYRIVLATTCTAAAFTGSPTYVVGGASTYQAASSALALTSPLSLAAAAGTGRDFCLEFSIPTGSSQATYGGATASLPITITGTST